jgi:alpha/beta superfamily hydrolase
MEDQIVASCSHYISEAGIEVLAFNFRGVQQSEGKYDGGRGERDDTLAAIDHLLQISSKARVGVVGFSFGAWVGLDAGNQHMAVDLLVGIAPVVSADFRYLQASSKRKLIVFAEHDQHTDELAMRAWLQSLSQPLETCFVPGVGHLFDDRVDTVGRKVAEFLSTNL